MHAQHNNPKLLHESLKRTSLSCLTHFIESAVNSFAENDHYLQIKRFVALGYNIGALDAVTYPVVSKTLIEHATRRYNASPWQFDLVAPAKQRFLDALLTQFLYAYYVDSSCAKGRCTCTSGNAAADPLPSSTPVLMSADKAVKALNNPLVQALIKTRPAAKSSLAFEEAAEPVTRLDKLADALVPLPLEQDPIYHAFDQSPDFNWKARGVEAKVVDPLPDLGDQTKVVRNERRSMEQVGPPTDLP